jgi:excisionase family DNA binding protein
MNNPKLTAKESRLDALLTYDEAARFLGVAKSTLYSMVSQGQIDVVQFGAGRTKQGCTRFRPFDLIKFVENRVGRKNCHSG